jgi:hypothetical protein
VQLAERVLPRTYTFTQLPRYEPFGRLPLFAVCAATGTASADAKSFELVAKKESETYGIRSNPFLEHAFNTVEYRIKVTINGDGSWSYDEDTVMMIRGKDEPFHHMDRNQLVKVAEPTPNPLAR